MNILMTGGTGFVGNSLGRHLVREGHKIRLLTRRPEQMRGRVSFPCEILGWGGASVARNIDVVIHLAGESVAEGRWTAARKRSMIQSRLQPIKLLREAFQALNHQPRLFISASAVGFYGDRGDEELSEDATAGADFLARLCQDWEREALDFPSERYVSLRLGMVLAPDRGFLAQVAPLFMRFGASVLGDGNQYVSWIHIEDVCRSISQILGQSELSGPINITAPAPLTNRQLTHDLAHALHAHAAPAVPKIVVRARYGEMGDLLLASQRALPRALQRSSFTWKYSTLHEALTEIYQELLPGEELKVWDQWLPGSFSEVARAFTQVPQPDAHGAGVVGIGVRWESDKEVLGNGVWVQDRVYSRVPLGAAGRLLFSPLRNYQLNSLMERRQDLLKTLNPQI